MYHLQNLEMDKFKESFSSNWRYDIITCIPKR